MSDTTPPPPETPEETDASAAPSKTPEPVKVSVRRADPRWREWLLPRSVLGITAMLVAFSIGASLTGVALYSYYEYRLTNNEKRVDSYIGDFDQRFRTASETIDAEKQNAQASVQKELEPLRQFQAEGGTVASLTNKVSKSVYFVQTLDENGAPSVGTAFVVASNGNQSVLVTSFSTVKASTHTPAPQINLSKGDDKIPAKLVNWVEDKDLAVVTIDRGDLPKLDFVPSGQTPRVGERTFAASGLGSAGASMTQGFVSDVSQGVLQQDAAIGPSFQGGPLLNSNGQVTAVASANYSPYGFAPGGSVTWSIPIRNTCDKLLKCPSGNNSVNGANPR